MAEIKEENSYTNILKRLSAFGGVQIFNILLSLLRGKFVALFLGPAGMGVASLYTSSLSPLQQFCGLGLNLAVVKEIAANKDKETSLSRVMRVALRLLIFTSLLGTVVTPHISLSLAFHFCRSFHSGCRSFGVAARLGRSETAVESHPCGWHVRTCFRSTPILLFRTTRYRAGNDCIGSIHVSLLLYFFQKGITPHTPSCSRRRVV